MRRLAAGLVALAAVAAFPALAAAHARISPPVSVANELQLYSLAVPTEKSGASTTKIVLTVPAGFAIDSFVANPGWHRVLQQTGSGDNAVIQRVTWTGGHVPTGEDALFQFLAQPAAARRYTFTVQQIYSDGSIVNWSGSESSASPAPTIDVKSSFGGGGSGKSTVSIIALVVGLVALVGVGLALVGGPGRRPLA